MSGIFFRDIEEDVEAEEVVEEVAEEEVEVEDDEAEEEEAEVVAEVAVVEAEVQEEEEDVQQLKGKQKLLFSASGEQKVDPIKRIIGEKSFELIQSFNNNFKSL